MLECSLHLHLAELQIAAASTKMQPATLSLHLLICTGKVKLDWTHWSSTLELLPQCNCLAVDLRVFVTLLQDPTANIEPHHCPPTGTPRSVAHIPFLYVCSFKRSAQRLVVPPSRGGTPNGPTTNITATWDVPSGATGMAELQVVVNHDGDTTLSHCIVHGWCSSQSLTLRALLSEPYSQSLTLRALLSSLK